MIVELDLRTRRKRFVTLWTLCRLVTLAVMNFQLFLRRKNFWAFGTRGFCILKIKTRMRNAREFPIKVLTMYRITKYYVTVSVFGLSK